MTSLEIVNKHIEEKIKVANFDKCNINKYLSLLRYEELEKIKQDLEEKQKLEIKLNGFIQLIKELFNEIDIGYNFDCNREPAYEYEMYFNDNGGTDRCINEDLYMILLKLYRMVGDSQ